MAVSLNTSYRFGRTRRHGFGFSKNSGADWVVPYSNMPPILVFDANGQPHNLVLDRTDNLYYDITTRDGPPELSLVQYFKDKVAVAGTGGTAVLPIVEFPRDRGSSGDYFLDHRFLQLGTRPLKESNRDAAGFDSNGYPDGLEIDVDLYADGNPTTKSAKAQDISLPKHQILLDQEARNAHRFSTKVTANNSEWKLAWRRNVYKVSDSQDGPQNRSTTERDWQGEFGTPTMRVGYSRGDLIDRATGSAVVETGITRIEGLDGISNSALQFATALTMPTITLTAGALLVWYQGVIAITIGGVAVVLTDHDTSGSWTLGYANALTESGVVLVTPTGTGKIFDLQAHSSISEDARTYYFADSDDNSGKIMLPKD